LSYWWKTSVSHLASPAEGWTPAPAGAAADAVFRASGHRMNDQKAVRLAYERHLARKMIL
jgi:hypothetical protein